MVPHNYMRNYSLHHLGLNNLLPVGRQGPCSNYPAGSSYLSTIFEKLNADGHIFWGTGSVVHMWDCLSPMKLNR